MASFLASGAFERHVRRMRRLYAARRAALLAGIEESLRGPRRRLLEVMGEAAGLHLALRFPRRASAKRAPAPAPGESRERFRRGCWCRASRPPGRSSTRPRATRSRQSLSSRKCFSSDTGTSPRPKWRGAGGDRRLDLDLKLAVDSGVSRSMDTRVSTRSADFHRGEVEVFSDVARFSIAAVAQREGKGG